MFGIYGKHGERLAKKTYLALYALQHRGQESCGIAVNDDGVISYHRGMGLVPDVFNQEELDHLGDCNMAMGATTSIKGRSNALPMVVRHVKGNLSIAHSGNLSNAHALREQLEMHGAIFHSSCDTELISHIIIQQRLKTSSIEEAVEQAMYQLEGAYNILLMSPTKLIAARDPSGFHPLSIGKLGDSPIFTTETCALDSLGAEFVREVKPGEIVVINQDGMRSITTHCKERGKVCVFEYVYIARPDSMVEGASVHFARRRAGASLAKESPVDADVVIGVPDSGLDAAMGYAEASGIPYGVGFVKNRYVGRTFIQPTQDEREAAVRIKLNVVSATVKDKRVVMIDDSIVRGTTSRRIVRLLREAGAKEVHVRISSPPFMHPCYFGTDIDSRDKLIACKMTTEEIAEHIGADSLAYLSLDGVKHMAAETKCDYCSGCFTGVYPIPEPQKRPQNKFERKLSERTETEVK